MAIHVVEDWRVFGLEDSVRASKYPMATDTNKCTSVITDRVKKLASCPTGTGHDNFLNGIVVQFDLTFSLKAWVEAQRYHFLDFVSSQSTMHRITCFDLNEQCNEYVNPYIIDIVRGIVEEYNRNPTPEQYLNVLYNIPAGFRYTARMTTSYRQLKTIYQQRKNHRLPEWREFCQWIEYLPHSYLITGKEGEACG
jgi:hypothetical protein